MFINPHPDCSLSPACIINLFKNIFSSFTLEIKHYFIARRRKRRIEKEMGKTSWNARAACIWILIFVKGKFHAKRSKEIENEITCYLRKFKIAFRRLKISSQCIYERGCSWVMSFTVNCALTRNDPAKITWGKFRIDIFVIEVYQIVQQCILTRHAACRFIIYVLTPFSDNPNSNVLQSCARRIEFPSVNHHQLFGHNRKNIRQS